jgi:DNA-binding NarL/FixJ family response regulator
MIGRAGALRRLRAVIDLAELHTSDLPAVALVAGEAGIGKTRLLREMVASLPSDVAVFSALAEPGSLGRPFDVARQLAPADADDPVAGALDVIGQAAQRGRVALVVEDVHWIDADSVSLLDHVARQPWSNVVLFATYRPSDLSRGAPGGDLVLRLERRNEVEQFRLDRLDRNEVAAMMTAVAARPVSSAAVEAVYRRSGGVPFVVEELLRCCGPEACSDDIVSAQLPWSLEEAVRQQLTGLTQSERAIIESLAVFGQPGGFEVLTDLTGFEERELLGHLRGLVERGVLVEPRDDRLWFGHALVAESVTNQLLGRERRRLHERCFDTLSRIAPEDYAALAMHASGAGRFDEIIAIARTGARAYLDRGSSFQALRLACQGLAECDDQPDLLAVATEAAWRLDFLEEALVHATNWREVAATTVDRIESTRFIARLHHEQGHDPECRAVLAELIELAESLTDPGEQARAEAGVAQLLMLLGDEAAAGWADRAIEHGTAAGDEHVVVQAKVEKASVHINGVRGDVALADLREAAEAARVLGDGVLLSRALNNSMELLPAYGEENKRMRELLRSTAAAIGFDKLGHLNALWWDASAAEAEGDLASYRRLIEEWASWSAAPKNGPSVALAVLAYEEGRVADGVALIEAVVSRQGDQWKHAVSLTRLALAVLERRPDAGRTAFEQFLAAGSVDDGWSTLGAVLELVAGALALDITPEEIRRRVLDELLVRHAARDTMAAWAEGLLASAEGRPGDAVAAFRATLGASENAVRKPIEASLRLAFAQALLASGDRVGALAECRIAREQLARWPGWRRDKVDAMLVRLEGSGTRHHDGALTARESEVAALIAEGLTNGQLAERLFISPKTAAVHVSNILAKLGLAGRAEIAAWAVRRELPIAG